MRIGSVVLRASGALCVLGASAQEDPVDAVSGASGHRNRGDILRDVSCDPLFRELAPPFPWRHFARALRAGCRLLVQSTIGPFNWVPGRSFFDTR